MPDPRYALGRCPACSGWGLQVLPQTPCMYGDPCTHGCSDCGWHFVEEPRVPDPAVNPPSQPIGGASFVARRILASWLVAIVLALSLHPFGDAATVTFLLGVATGVIVSHQSRARRE